MKKFIKEFFLNEIVLITFLLLFSLVVYFFYNNFNLDFLLWIIQSGVIIFLKYRFSNSIIGKTKLDKVCIYFIRLLFLFIETLCCFQFFAIFFVISYKLFYKNYGLILGLSFVLFLISMIVLGYLYEKYQISKRFDETLSQFVFNGLVSGILFFLFLFLFFDLFIFIISLNPDTEKVSDSAVSILVWFLPLLLPYVKEFSEMQSKYFDGSNTETSTVYDYFETCFKIIWFIYLIAIRIYLTLLSKGQMFNIPFRGRNFKIELKYPESIGEFFISTMLSFAITMLIFIGIQTLYEKVFITNNINRYIIKKNKKINDYDFIFKLDKSDNSIQFRGIVYNEKLFGIKGNSKLDNLGIEDCLIFKPFIDEKTNPNFFYSTGGTKEEYIEYISSSMGVKRKDFEKAISNPWKSKILSYVGNYCPND